MTAVHESRCYERLVHKKVHCTLCPHNCRIPDNGHGGTAIDGVGMSAV